MPVEYRVRPVTRYMVTRWFSEGVAGGVEPRGVFENAETAHAVAYALCKAEHDAAGTAPDDPNFVYPKPVEPAALA
jgi:hypothetical protein